MRKSRVIIDIPDFQFTLRRRLDPRRAESSDWSMICITFARGQASLAQTIAIDNYYQRYPISLLALRHCYAICSTAHIITLPKSRHSLIQIYKGRRKPNRHHEVSRRESAREVPHSTPPLVTNASSGSVHSYAAR